MGSGVAFTTGLAGRHVQVRRPGLQGRHLLYESVSCGAYRSYGNAQTNIAMEQVVDEMCYKLGLDPVEWRMKWHKGVGDDGWCMGFKYPSCALDECLRRGAEAIGWKEKRARYANQTGTKRRGVGVSVMNHQRRHADAAGTRPVRSSNEDATAGDYVVFRQERASWPRQCGGNPGLLSMTFTC